MRIRLFVTALAYAVFLLALLVFPPFHDGLHHLYTWRPAGLQIEAMVPDWVSPGWYIAHVEALTLPDLFRLRFEALIGMVSAALLFLLLELTARWRSCSPNLCHWRTLHGFLFHTP
jgi:hypothetical protein